MLSPALVPPVGKPYLMRVVGFSLVTSPTWVTIGPEYRKLPRRKLKSLPGIDQTWPDISFLFVCDHCRIVTSLLNLHHKEIRVISGLSSTKCFLKVIQNVQHFQIWTLNVYLTWAEWCKYGMSSPHNRPVRSGCGGCGRIRCFIKWIHLKKIST